MSSSFVHLHVHSDYSLLTGAVKPAGLVNRAAEFGMPALALTDSGNLFGAVEFYLAAKSAGVKPILGQETYVTRGSRHDKTPRNRSTDQIVLLVENRTGFKNLLQLSTTGFMEGFYYRPRIDYEYLEEHAEGLIGLSGGMNGPIARELLEGRPRQALELAARFKEIFDGRFYIEVQDHGIAHQRALIPQLVDVAKRADLGIVATNDVHYRDSAHAEAQDILGLIQQSRTIADGTRGRSQTNQRHFRSADEMVALFSGLPEAVRSTLEVAERVDFAMTFGELLLPDFPLPEGFTSQPEYLKHLAEQGLRERYAEITPEIRERIDYELRVILEMGYPGYFLIVWDFIKHAREQGIAVGPGRGSAAGSIVAYALRITDIDPMRFGLLFERFLNPERLSMPDIDVDFDYRRRGEVIEYVRAKYGTDSVTQIITFGTMAARGVIRDVGRALGMELSEIDKIAKLVPPELGITLDKALEQVPELVELRDSDDVHKRLIETARTLEGLSRHASTHAAGVLIAPGRLVDVVPLYQSGKGEASTQWDMNSCEKAGLLKMDFLGLRTLTVIEDALTLIEEAGAPRVDLAALPLDDAKTFELLRTAQTFAVFQLESSGMRDLLRRLQPQGFDDIVAVNALYRPGPMGSGMVQNFIDRRHGREKIAYEHPLLEPILESTYGMMVYQEQVMQIASAMAGFSLGDADNLRRAMGKKKAEEMAAQEKKFVDGAIDKEIAEATARKVFEQMAYFAGYGFNKSHSAAYAMVSYHTAYLKAHHPAAFMAATLSSEMDTTDRIMVLIEECRRMNIPVLPPDVNASRSSFSVENGAIRFGVAAVKNVGRAAIEAIVAEREKGGLYDTLFALTRRVPSENLNRRVLESLAAGGALDTLPGGRARLFLGAANAMEAGARHQHDLAMGQTSLFGASTDSHVDPELPECEDWDRATRLRNEKEALGFYLSEHPLDDYRDEISAVASGDTAHLKGLSGGEVKLLGVVSAVRRKQDKKNRTMAFLQIEDYAGTLEVVVFSRTFEECKEFLVEDKVVLVEGRLDRREPESDPKIVAERLVDFEANRSSLAHTLYLKLPTGALEESQLSSIGGILQRYPGQGEVVLVLETDTGRRVRMRARRYRVGVDRDLIAELRSMLGESCVRLGEAVNGRNGR